MHNAQSSDILDNKFHRITSIKQLSNVRKADLKDVKSMAMVREQTFSDFAKECTQIMSEFEAKTESVITAINYAKREQVGFKIPNISE